MSNPKKRIYIDIETAPMHPLELKDLEPQFEPKANLKDPEKIKADIAEKRQKWYDDATLSALYSRVCSMTVASGPDSIDVRFLERLTEQAEGALVLGFFDICRDCTSGADGKLFGFNIHEFDLVFLVRRALLLGISVPSALLPSGSGRFYWPSWTTDLREIWGCGEYRPSGSLDVISKSMGLHGKEISGADFHKHLYGSPAEREIALNYARLEAKNAWVIAERFGVLR